MEHQKIPLRSFFLRIAVILLVFMIGIMGLVLKRHNDFINSGILSTARSYHTTLMLFWKWNSSNGGLFTMSKPGAKPDLKNHVIMTREVFRYSMQAGSPVFTITSFTPLNEAGIFETDALRSFQKGAREYFRKEKSGGRVFFRYMAPLVADRSCLACHATQGYTEGSITGGIGVSIDITSAMRSLLFQNISTIIISIVGFALLLILVYTFVMNLVKKIRAADNRIDLLSVTDELTGLYNRRMFFFRLEDEMNRIRRYGDSFSLLLIHIDHLRNLIDNRGPDAGDLVLQTVAEKLRSLCRKTDSVCRFAHDEMSVLLPSTGNTEAINIAEKICTHIGSLETRYDDFQILRVTVSIGVVILDQKALDIYGDAKRIINAADLAVDRARNDGRNCVRVSPGTDV